MVEGLEEKINARINVLQSVYDVVRGRAKHRFHKSALFEEALKSYKIKKEPTLPILDYLSDKNLVVLDSTDDMHITSGGVDEVENEFPVLRGRIFVRNDFNDNISGISKGNKNVMEKIDEMDKEKIKIIKNDLIKKTEKLEKMGYSFSVFISHSTRDLEFISLLCDELIKNKILPRLWFRKVSKKIVREKLCDLIDSSDLFLIYYSTNSLSSQMTNNEIGFIEGKKYYMGKYRNIKPEIIYKIRDTQLNLKYLEGFYTNGDDIPDCDSEDLNRIVLDLKSRYNYNIRLIQKDRPAVKKEILEYAQLPTLKKLARPTSIKVTQNSENLKNELLKLDDYSVEDYLHIMRLKELKKICKHFKQPVSGKNLELILRIKKHINR